MTGTEIIEFSFQAFVAGLIVGALFGAVTRAIRGLFQ